MGSEIIVLIQMVNKVTGTSLSATYGNPTPLTDGTNGVL